MIEVRRWIFPIGIVTLTLIGLAFPAIGRTVASFLAASSNPFNTMQAGTVRLAGETDGSPLFDLRALLPGETVDRAVAVENAGTNSVHLELGVSAPGADGDAPALDPVRGIQLRVDQCKTGPWIEATTAPGTATPPVAGRRLVCQGATPGAGATVVPVYEGPALPRGVTKPNAPTPTVMPVPVPGVFNPGERASLRVRASLPDSVPGEVGDSRAPGTSLDFTWRASDVGVNLAGTPLGNARGTPVTQTPPAPVPTGTATLATPSTVATRTSTPTATATATATASIEYPAYGGMAVELDGGNDAVAVSWSGTTSLAQRSNWSFDLWLRPSSVNGARTIYAENDLAGADVLAIRLNEGRPEVGTRVISRAVPWQWIAVTTAPALPANVWSHLSVSFAAGSAVRIDVNGSTIASETDGSGGRLASPSVATNSQMIGWSASGNSAAFAGTIDEVRFWGDARTVGQVVATMPVRLRGVEAGLLVYYPILSTETRGVTIADASDHGHSGILSGGLRWVRSTAPISGIAPVGAGTAYRSLTITNTTNVALVDHQVQVVSPYANGSWMVTHPDDATGTWVVDDTGERHAGVAVGGVSWLPGAGGSAMTLSGSAYLSLGTAPSITGTGPFAVHARIRTSAVAGQVIIQQRDTNNFDGEYQLHTTGQGTLRWWSYGGGQTGFTVESSRAVTDGEWHSVTATREADGSGRIYIDGVLDGSNAAPARPLIPITVAVGRDIRDNSGQFVGQIDDIRIFNRSVSPAEVPLLSAFRYTDENNYPLPFWRESGGRTWVRVPAIPASGSVTVRQFWGNASLSDGSDGVATFDAFDDFNGTSVDTARWTIVNPASGFVNVSGGRLSISSGGDWWETGDTALFLVSKSRVNGPYVTETLMVALPPNTYTRSFGVRGSASTSAPMFVMLFNADMTRITNVARDAAGATAVYFGESSGIPYPGKGQIARFDIDGTKVTNRLGNVVVNTRTVPGWDLGYQALTSTHNASSPNEFAWFRVRKFEDSSPAVSFGNETEPRGQRP